MNETYLQLAHLSDVDLSQIYLTSKKILKERGIYDNLHQNFRSKKLSKSVFEFKKVGKIIRNNKKSILPDILSEDWSFLFNDYSCDTSSNDFYVYLHLDPNKPYVFNGKTDNELRLTGKPFYVGKGKGDRAFNMKRSSSHLSIINSLKDQGKTMNDIVYIFESNLSELEALILESKLISFFGSRNECDPSKTHLTGEKGGWLLNSSIPPRPVWIDQIIRRQ